MKKNKQTNQTNKQSLQVGLEIKHFQSDPVNQPCSWLYSFVKVILLSVVTLATGKNLS